MASKTEILDTKYTGLIPVKEGGKFQGLKNLMRTEISRWKRTGGWWLQLLAILGMANGITFMAILGSGDPEIGLMIFPLMAGLYIPLVAMTSVQGAIVAERTEGTAAWVLSKPVTRHAFITSKFLTNMISITISMVLAPFLLIYVEFNLLGIPASFLGTMIAAGFFWMWCMFWLTLALMLGTILKTRKSVMYVMLTIYILFFGVGDQIPAIINPLMFWPQSGSTGQLSMMSDQIMGTLNLNLAPVVIMACSILFLAIAIKKFLKLEL